MLLAEQLVHQRSVLLGPLVDYITNFCDFSHISMGSDYIFTPLDVKNTI